MSKSDHSALLKTCSICGLPKPLSAFLQYAGTAGAHYSNVCSACRKAEIEKAQKLKADEGGTTSRTGRTLDANARVEAEAEKREDLKQVSEEYYEEREEKDVQKIEKAEKIISIEKQEKKHRESFLDRSFATKKETVTKSILTQRAEEGAKQAAEKQADTNKSEDIAKNIHTAGTTITAGMDTSEKFKGGTFRAFLTQLGTSPIGRAFAQNAQNEQKTAAEKQTTVNKNITTDTATKKNVADKNAMFSKEAVQKETLAERIEKTWGPGKKR